MSAISWLFWFAALAGVFWLYQAVDLARWARRPLPPVTQQWPFKNAPAQPEPRGRHRAGGAR
ncbi:MAG: hypothetical protein J2P25_14420 [Nocardiopsaceae bacterium]|nr:hypothetical protein [Nocardiopsaceae bacterium]